MSEVLRGVFWIVGRTRALLLLVLDESDEAEGYAFHDCQTM